MSNLRLAADIGGTFTDIALLSDEGELFTAKVPSTPEDYASAILDGCRKLISEKGIAPAGVKVFLHASTIATNAILEGKGARTALITTAGFRDILELRRIRVPRLYEPLYRKPEPLVPRRYRFEVTERVGADGGIVQDLDEAELQRIIDEIAASNIEAVAVCFLNSYVNPVHERRAGEILREGLSGRFITLSVDVLPEVREYERTSTTVINAYVGPPVKNYLTSLRAKLDEAGFSVPLQMMQSSGGLLDLSSVIAKPALVVESGPAAGVIGAARLGALSGYDNIITLDMGGTTAKAAVIENGRLVSTDEYEVGGGISLSSRLVKGGGYALKFPVIDVSEVGAGGGSIIWRDQVGHLKVGPKSAGSVPGPACYDRGGTLPTVTDANVVLGYLSPVSIAGGTVPIDSGAAKRALASVADDRALRDVAYGVVQLAAANMMRAVKAVTTYRGRDPRDFVLFAFGGGGGLYAGDLARALNIRRVVVPPAAGVFSALGLLFADLEVTVSRGFLARLDQADAAEIRNLFRALEDAARADLSAGSAPLVIECRLDIRYQGQAFELSIGVQEVPDLIAASDRFDAEHEATYGHRLPVEHPKQIVAVRLIARMIRDVPPRLDAKKMLEAYPARPASRRSVYFGGDDFVETEIIGRANLSMSPRQGPLVIEEYEGTTVVPPDGRAHLDENGNIIIDLE
jgi:N-methylhydantoinase A